MRSHFRRRAFLSARALKGKSLKTQSIREVYYGRHRMAFRVGSYLALVRIMAIGDLVGQFYGRSELAAETHRRLARTRETIRDMILYGFTSPQGAAAVDRFIRAHRYLPQAEPDDYRYVLSVLVLEPVQWAARFGGVSISDEEFDCLSAFWQNVGALLGYPLDGSNQFSPSREDWEQFHARYEDRKLRATPFGQRLAQRCLEEVTALALPFGTRRLFGAMMRYSMDPKIRELLGIRKVWPVTRLLLLLLIRIHRARQGQNFQQIQ
ncbi:MULTISPECIES: oxygenase MpaB family protein [unclassified Sinorhizobium]|uniref:oxygenase MpaB family protein n=1 Tax=unclassified Sinorhizobium TaxID=2613772 RepID=UPI00352607D4